MEFSNLLQGEKIPDFEYQPWERNINNAKKKKIYRIKKITFKGDNSKRIYLLSESDDRPIFNLNKNDPNLLLPIKTFEQNKKWVTVFENFGEPLGILLEEKKISFENLLEILKKAEALIMDLRKKFKMKIFSYSMYNVHVSEDLTSIKMSEWDLVLNVFPKEINEKEIKETDYLVYSWEKRLTTEKDRAKLESFLYAIFFLECLLTLKNNKSNMENYLKSNTIESLYHFLSDYLINREFQFFYHFTSRIENRILLDNIEEFKASITRCCEVNLKPPEKDVSNLKQEIESLNNKLIEEQEGKLLISNSLRSMEKANKELQAQIAEWESKSVHANENYPTQIRELEKKYQSEQQAFIDKKTMEWQSQKHEIERSHKETMRKLLEEADLKHQAQLKDEQRKYQSDLESRKVEAKREKESLIEKLRKSEENLNKLRRELNDELEKRTSSVLINNEETRKFELEINNALEQVEQERNNLNKKFEKEKEEIKRAAEEDIKQRTNEIRKQFEQEKNSLTEELAKLKEQMRNLSSKFMSEKTRLMDQMSSYSSEQASFEKQKKFSSTLIELLEASFSKSKGNSFASFIRGVLTVEGRGDCTDFAEWTKEEEFRNCLKHVRILKLDLRDVCWNLNGALDAVFSALQHDKIEGLEMQLNCNPLNYTTLSKILEIIKSWKLLKSLKLNLKNKNGGSLSKSFFDIIEGNQLENIYLDISQGTFSDNFFKNLAKSIRDKRVIRNLTLQFSLLNEQDYEDLKDLQAEINKLLKYNPNKNITLDYSKKN